MQGGDISNEVVARLVLVFEGLIGLLIDPKAQAAFDKAMKRGKYKEAVNAYEINEIVAKHIYHLSYHLGFNLDVVTFLGDEFAEELDKRLSDREGFPITHAWASTPSKLARELSYRPDIAKIYDAEPSRWASWGSKGAIINPFTPQFM